MSALRFATSLGPCVVLWHDAGLTGFRLPDESAPPAAANESAPAWVEAIVARVRRHFAGELQDFANLNFDFAQVAEFPRQVYRATLAIKPGRTCSYGDIARALGQPPGVSRAIGAALGANPWPLLVPCHRVVAHDGKMTGFSGPGGIRTKLRLLALEGAQLFAD